MRQRDIDALLSAMNDYRAVVAAGKVQRWDVVKWTVALNFGFATAAVALRATLLFLVFSISAAVIGTSLVLFYNRRMTRTRRLMEKLSDKLADDCLDVRKVEKDERNPKSFWYDCTSCSYSPRSSSHRRCRWSLCSMDT